MIAALPAQLRRAVSPYVGIVRSVDECLRSTQEPTLFQATCEVAAGTNVIGAALDHLSGIGGTGRTRQAAAAAAVGEALERYSATYVAPARLVTGSAEELGDLAVAPERFALFSERQYATDRFPFRRFDATTRIAWVQGRELRTDRPALLPAELVFLGPARAGGEQPIAFATSSGLACAETTGEAVIRAVCELLERDAFMIVWANRLELPLVEVAPGTELAAIEEECFAPTGLRYAAIDLSVFHRLPSVLGVVRGPEGAMGVLGVGAGTAATIEQAWLTALSEAFSARSAGIKLSMLAPACVAGAVVTFEDHIRYHADPSNVEAGRFLDASRRRTPAGSIAPLGGRATATLISALCDRVEAAGAMAYAVDVTAPDVAALGLTVTRVIAPELCSLDVRHAARFLGGPRASFRHPPSWVSALGASARKQVNPDPHPFP